MMDATVAPKVGFISPVGTTACNVNHINCASDAGRSRSDAGAKAVPHRLQAAVRPRLDQQDAGFGASDPGFCQWPTDETATSLNANVTPALNGGRQRIVRDLVDEGGPYGYGNRVAWRPRPARNARRT